MNLVLAGVLAYVAAMLVIGFAIGRRISTEEDYLLAGRSLGPLLALFTIFATWFGAETCVGAAGEAFRGGLSATNADPFGYALCLLLMGLLFAVPLWRRKLTTLADLFRQRYGPGAERLVAVLLIPTSVLWAAAQIRAFGQVLAATSDLQLTLTITIAAGVTITYTAAGGLLADAVSDLIQGTVLLVGLVIVGVLFVQSGDHAALGALPEGHATLIRTDRPLLETLESWAIPVLGALVAQELVARVIASRSPSVARNATVAAAGLYFVAGLIPVLLGLAAAGLLIDLDQPEQVLVHMADRYLPTVLYVVFAGALVSAILSTVDTALLVAGSLAAHNLILPMRRQPTEPQKLATNRLMVVTFGVVAFVLALSADSVYHLVVEASGLGTAGVLVAVVFGLFSRLGGPAAAVATLVVGLAVYVIGGYAVGLPYPFLTSLAAAVATFVAIGLIEPRHAAA